MHGFYRVASAVNKTVVANPKANSEEIISLLKIAESNDVSIVVFPELTLTGYTISDLFFNQTIIQKQNESLKYILKETKNISTVAIIGIAFMDMGRLYIVALVYRTVRSWEEFQRTIYRLREI